MWENDLENRYKVLIHDGFEYRKYRSPAITVDLMENHGWQPAGVEPFSYDDFVGDESRCQSQMLAHPYYDNWGYKVKKPVN